MRWHIGGKAGETRLAQGGLKRRHSESGCIISGAYNGKPAQSPRQQVLGVHMSKGGVVEKSTRQLLPRRRRFRRAAYTTTPIQA